MTAAELVPDNVTKKNRQPRGLYLGTIVGTDLASRGFVLERIRQEIARLCKKHGGLKVFTRPLTEDGLRLARKHKFVTVVTGERPQMNFTCVKEWH